MRAACNYAMLIIILSLLSLTTKIDAATKSKRSSSKDEAGVPLKFLRMCQGYKTLSSKKDVRTLKWLLQASGEASLEMSSSPQHQAACWLLHKDARRKKSKSQSSTLQRYALATLYFTTTRSNTTNWDWSNTPVTRSTSKWMSAHHECSWFGVECDVLKRVINLDLGYMKIDGILPREISLLSHLVDIDLHGNDLQGVLPHKMLHALKKLEYLRLHMNGFFGALHREIQGFTKLKELYLFGNYIAGKIPVELTQLRNLHVIDLYANQLSGTIPSELGRLKKLQYLDLHDNNLVGRVPQEVCNLKIKEFITDCLGPKPEVDCPCCTVCCRGLPEFKCVRVATGEEVIV